jgi:hypothetical protein
MLQETQRTPDYLSSLRSPRCYVDSSLGSFSPVPTYFHILSDHRSGYRFRITCCSKTVKSPSCRISFSESSARAFASDSTRRLRPACRILAPLALASRRTLRPSSVAWRRTKPACSRPATMRLIVGGRTCSASASSLSDLGPPKTKTESADSCAGPTPLSRSRARSRRKRWMAAECSLSAISTGWRAATPFFLTTFIQFS